MTSFGLAAEPTPLTQLSDANFRMDDAEQTTRDRLIAPGQGGSERRTLELEIVELRTRKLGTLERGTL